MMTTRILNIKENKYTCQENKGAGSCGVYSIQDALSKIHKTTKDPKELRKEICKITIGALNKWRDTAREKKIQITIKKDNSVVGIGSDDYDVLEPRSEYNPNHFSSLDVLSNSKKDFNSYFNSKYGKILKEDDLIKSTDKEWREILKKYRTECEKESYYLTNYEIEIFMLSQGFTLDKCDYGNNLCVYYFINNNQNEVQILNQGNFHWMAVEDIKKLDEVNSGEEIVPPNSDKNPNLKGDEQLPVDTLLEDDNQSISDITGPRCTTPVAPSVDDDYHRSNDNDQSALSSELIIGSCLLIGLAGMCITAIF